MADILTPQQIEFLTFYTDPKSETYSNARQSAIKAKYSEEYASNITSLLPKWLSDVIGTDVAVGEIVEGIKKETVTDKSSDRLKAWELLGKYKKMFTEKHEHSGLDGKPIEYKVVSFNDSSIQVPAKTVSNPPTESV